MKLNTQSFFWIYILELENGKYYTGYTNDIERRFAEHRGRKTGAKCMRISKPKVLARSWRIFAERSTCMKIETLIKQQSHEKKKQLIRDPESLKILVAENLQRKITIEYEM